MGVTMPSIQVRESQAPKGDPDMKAHKGRQRDRRGAQLEAAECALAAGKQKRADELRGFFACAPRDISKTLTYLEVRTNMTRASDLGSHIQDRRRIVLPN
jgi:hypothetical protein